jgi:hypothetical protein
MAVGVGVKYQVKYVDSNGTTQVLAQHKTSNDDSDLDATATSTADRILITRRHQAFDSAKVWCDPNIVGNLPLANSNYDTAQNGQSEPEILIEEWNGSGWDTIFRGFAKSKPSTNADGQSVFKLKGFGRYTGKQDVNYSAAADTSIDTILENLLPSGYTVDAASASKWPGGSIPTADNYSLKDAERQIGYREIAKNYNASIQFKTTLSNGDYEVRLEPVGSGGTVDTIYSPASINSSSDTLGLFREWQGENVENIVNKVRVIGRNTSGTKIDETVKDSTSITDYGVKFKKKNIPYIESASEAQDIGNNLLSPNPSQGGVVKTPRFTQEVVNDSFQLEDTNNNLSSVFTAVQTRNYLHEQAVELTFEFETGSEAQAENQVETVYERSKVYPNSQTDVGDQNIDTSESNTTTAQGDISASDENRSPNTSGSTTASFGEGNYSFAQESLTNASISSLTVSDTAPNLEIGILETEHFIVNSGVFVDSPTESSGDFEVVIENNDTNTEYFRETFNNIPLPANLAPAIIQSEAIDGDSISTTVIINSSGSYNAVLTQTIDSIRQHDHGTTGSTDSHGHNPDANDAGHGDTNDPSTHNLEGSTEAGQNINVATEDKTDR